METPTKEVQNAPVKQSRVSKPPFSLSDPNHLIIKIPTGEYLRKKVNKPIASYNNGLLKMMIDNVLKKFPADSFVVNENIPEKIRKGKA